MKTMLKSAWALLREGSRDDAQVALAVSALALASSIGLTFTFLWGLTARDAATCGVVCHLSGGGLAVLAAAGAFSAGGVLGLLFGAPRWGESGGAPAAAGAAQPSAAAAGVRPNTSLERVSDWLTTIIVGLGLVHLKSMKEEVSEMGIWLTNAITLQSGGTNGTPGVVLALAFSVAGFLLVYLWSLRFLPSELQGAYAALKKLEAQKEDLSKKIEKFKTDSLFPVSEQARKEIADALNQLGVDEATVAEVVKRYSGATRWIDEPMKDFGPPEADGYALTVELQDVQPGIWSFKARLTSAAASPEDRAVWLLHNSFGPTVWAESQRGDQGLCYENHTNGAFCLGAVVLRNGKPPLRLSLDMRTLPGVSDAFKEG